MMQNYMNQKVEDAVNLAVDVPSLPLHFAVNAAKLMVNIKSLSKQKKSARQLVNQLVTMFPILAWAV